MKRDSRWENVMGCITPSEWRPGEWMFAIEVIIDGREFGSRFYAEQKLYDRSEVYSYILDKLVKHVDEYLEMNGYTREG